MRRPKGNRPKLWYIALTLALGAMVGLWLQDVVDGDDGAAPAPVTTWAQQSGAM